MPRTKAPAISGRIRAAEYLRMSTEHQQYSLDNQTAVIRLYAVNRGFEVVRSYCDAGRSGLSLTGRPGLRQLLDDVTAGVADYNAVLVYDVSRWGRFQDPDEAASYEMQCRRAGVTVQYCAEQFENDGSFGAAIMKVIKRAMAAEYSRELSAKVYAGQARLARKGYKLGGPAIYGMRRLLIDKEGNDKGILRLHEEKHLATDRVVHVPGPLEEQAIVCEIFELFAAGKMGEKAIARLLNGRGILRHNHIPWTRDSIAVMLRHAPYVGHVVWGRTSVKLHGPLARNAPSTWITCDNAHEGFLDQKLFDRVQQRLAERKKMSDEQMLEWLRALWKRCGRLSGDLINAYRGPSVDQLVWRFGSLHAAYEAIGYKPWHHTRYLPLRERLQKERASRLDHVIGQIRALGIAVEYDMDTDRLRIGGERAAFFVLHCTTNRKHVEEWPLPIEHMDAAGQFDKDIIIAQRLTSGNDADLDYYVLPRAAFHLAPRGFNPWNARFIEQYRFAEICADAFAPLRKGDEEIQRIVLDRQRHLFRAADSHEQARPTVSFAER